MEDFSPPWDERRARRPLPGPDPWLLAAAPVFSAGLPGPVLDLACGLGQNGLWVSSLGLEVVGVDSSEAALRQARQAALRRELPAVFRVADVEAPGFGLPGGAAWGGVLVFHFLHRPLLSTLPDLLAPGGILVYKTHLHHVLRPPGSRPRRSDFLLRSGELLRAFRGLVPLHYREWARGAEAFAALLARRPPHSR